MAHSGGAVPQHQQQQQQAQQEQQQDSDERRCGLPGCSAADAPSRCSRCRRVYYCGSQHQRADWPRHKTECHPPAVPRPDAGDNNNNNNNNTKSANTSTTPSSSNIGSSNGRGAAAGAAATGATFRCPPSRKSADGTRFDRDDDSSEGLPRHLLAGPLSRVGLGDGPSSNGGGDGPSSSSSAAASIPSTSGRGRGSGGGGHAKGAAVGGGSNFGIPDAFRRRASGGGGGGDGSGVDVDGSVSSGGRISPRRKEDVKLALEAFITNRRLQHGDEKGDPVTAASCCYCCGRLLLNGPEAWVEDVLYPNQDNIPPPTLRAQRLKAVPGYPVDAHLRAVFGPQVRDGRFWHGAADVERSLIDGVWHVAACAWCGDEDKGGSGVGGPSGGGGGAAAAAAAAAGGSDSPTPTPSAHGGKGRVKGGGGALYRRDVACVTHVSPHLSGLPKAVADLMWAASADVGASTNAAVDGAAFGTTLFGGGGGAAAAAGGGGAADSNGSGGGGGSRSGGGDEELDAREALRSLAAVEALPRFLEDDGVDRLRGHDVMGHAYMRPTGKKRAARWSTPDLEAMLFPWLLPSGQGHWSPDSRVSYGQYVAIRLTSAARVWGDDPDYAFFLARRAGVPAHLLR